VTLRGVVVACGDELVYALGPNRGFRLNVELLTNQNATVEVTLPVDHPSRDLVGTVRGDAVNVWIKVDKYGYDEGDDTEPHPGYSGIWWNVLDGEERTGDDVEEWPVLGAVPNTPAARIQVPTRKGESR
jgi:hypothetical protein